MSEIIDGLRKFLIGLCDLALKTEPLDVTLGKAIGVFQTSQPPYGYSTKTDTLEALTRYSGYRYNTGTGFLERKEWTKRSAP